MKTTKFTPLIAVGALLPLAAWGQTNVPPDTHKGGLAADKPGASARESHTPADVNASDIRQDPNSPHYSPGSTNPTRRDTSLSSSGSSGATGLSGAASGQHILRVSSETLSQRVTASELMGKKVVDREGQEIGKVKDVGLTAVAPQLASQSSMSSSSSTSTGQSGSAGVSGTNAGGGLQQQGASSVSISQSTSPGLRPDDTTVDGRDRQEDPFIAQQRLRREVDRAGTAGSDPSVGASSQSAQTGQSQNQQLTQIQSDQLQQASAGGQPRIFVQPERSLGLSGDLIAIPTSQIHREGDTLRVDMSREEIRAIVAQQPRSSRVSLAE